MNVEIKTEAVQFLLGKYINRIFFAVCSNNDEEVEDDRSDVKVISDNDDVENVKKIVDNSNYFCFVDIDVLDIMIMITMIRNTDNFD
jgi:hypothetical protein